MNIKNMPFNTYNVTITITTTITNTITITALPDWWIRILTGLRLFDNDYDLMSNLQIFFTWDEHGHEHGHIFTADPVQTADLVRMTPSDHDNVEHVHEHEPDHDHNHDHEHKRTNAFVEV